MKDSFGKLNPFVNLTFFAFVILLTMFTQNPICTAISFVCAVINAVYMGRRAVCRMLIWLVPTAVIFAAVNPLFNHEGATIITYFAWGNPLTLESIIYGIVTAVLLFSAVLWFLCFNRVMTSDKLVYMFGKLAPALSLVLSMTLRFVPRFNAQLKKVRQAQKGIGQDFGNGGIVRRIKNGVKILSIMITWALENAIETADSMKSRGYGLKGRTSYSIYRFEKHDIVLMGIITAIGIADTLCIAFDLITFWYFPTFGGDLLSGYSIFYYISLFCLMIMPFVINVLEGAEWKRSQSAI